MRWVKQSRALHIHNGDTVGESWGGKPRTNSTQSFHKQPVSEAFNRTGLTGTAGPHPGPRVRKGSPQLSLLGQEWHVEGEREKERERGVSRGFAWIHNHVTLNCFLLEATFIINLSVVLMSRWSVLKYPVTDKVHWLQSVINSWYTISSYSFFWLCKQLINCQNHQILHWKSNFPKSDKHQRVRSKFIEKARLINDFTDTSIIDI